MKREYFENIDYKKIDFSRDVLVKGDYEGCSFSECNFEGAGLSGFSFIDCNFRNCNLSNAKLSDTGIRTVSFEGCKMLGLHFEYCNAFLFQAAFNDCSLDLSSFFRRNMKKSIFRNCSLKEVDFTETELQSARFDNCNLEAAIFLSTNLEKCDLRTSFNFIIDPEKNTIRKAKFSLNGLPGLLMNYELDIS